MGLFGGSTTIQVASSVYNLAGDELDRPDYLKASLFAGVMNPYDQYLGETVVGNYLAGPGIMQRSFFNWAVRNDVAGLPTFKISNALSIDPTVLSTYITIPASPSGLVNRIKSSEITDGDYSYWAEQWLYANNPAELLNQWISDYDSVTHQITIQYEGGGTVVIGATNYDKDKKYVIARYYQVVPSTEDDPSTTVYGNEGVFIYEKGTGNAVLDALIVDAGDTTSPGYYPFVPVRLNNVSITEPQFEDLYEESVKVYKRATGGPVNGGSFLKIIEKIEDNPDLGDIDYSYLQWGVSVNVFEPACRRYMYEWFKSMIPFQNSSPTTMTNYINTVNAYNSLSADLSAWTTAQSFPSDPLYGTSRPTEPIIKDPISTTVRLVSDHPQLGNFDNRFTWVNISETTSSGLGKVGAVPGDIWFETGTALTWNVQAVTSGSNGGGTAYTIYRRLDQMKLYKQVGVNSYSLLTIWGMVNENYIYGGKAVRITLKDGVEDTDESGFIVPLHAPSVKALGIKDYTQLSTSNAFLTFNSYLVVKKKWYQSFLGMLLIVIAIVVISALISPAAVGSASGIFGTNAALGASFGLSGTAAIVAGAATNAIAAVIVSQAISTLSVSTFGEKWGSIIGAIASFAIGFGIANGFDKLSLVTMLNPQTLLKFSSSLANGYSGFIQGENLDISGQMIENQEGFEKAKKDMADLMRSMGLINDLSFDPLTLTNSVRGNGSSSSGSYVPETVDQFIGRTTMTGSDVVDITLSMVSDYANLQLTLPKS